MAVILMIAEYLPPEKVDGKLVDCRHIVSVFKIVQELIAPSRVKGKSQFQLLMEQLPPDHKTKWFAGAVLNFAEQAMMSVLSTEPPKVTDQMKWVGLMSAVKAQVEEIIFTELIFALGKVLKF